MSNYVRYTQQCDVCFVVLSDATNQIVSGITPPGFRAAETVRSPWTFDTCAECAKELGDALENLKTLMQMKRAQESSDKQLRMTKKEWDMAHANETAAVSAMDKWPGDVNDVFLRRDQIEHMKQQIEKMRHEEVLKKMRPIALDPSKVKVGGAY